MNIFNEYCKTEDIQCFTEVADLLILLSLLLRLSLGISTKVYTNTEVF